MFETVRHVMQKVSWSRLPPVWPSDVIRNGQKCQSLAKVLKAGDPRSYHLARARTHTRKHVYTSSAYRGTEQLRCTW